MKKIFLKLLFLIAGVGLLASCQSDEIKAVIKSPSGVTITLSSTATQLVLDSTNASSTTAATLNWTAAKYGADVAVTYTLLLDTGDFSKPLSIGMAGLLTKEFTERALNDVALINFSFVPGVSKTLYAKIKADIDPGVVASVMSNTISIDITAYSEIPPPKYPVPDSLYLVGDATPGGWGNPVPTPSQHFTRIDDHTFGMIIQLTGGNSYLLLPKNGDWGHKYSVTVPTASANPAGDAFQPDAPNNIPAPAASGLYKIIIDFVKGTYAVTAVANNPIPAGLFIVGDATAGGWNNPVPVPSQQFKQVSNGEFSITIPMTAGGYLMLPVNGDWSHKYGGTDAAGGTLLADGNVPGSNTPSPGVGTYTINVNFFTMKFTVK